MEAQSPNAFAQFDSLAVIIASAVAVYGIWSWKREHLGRRRIDLAEETLTLFYEAQEVINTARSIGGWDNEYREAEKLQREASGKEAGPQEVLIVTYRLYRHNDLFAKIRALRYRFAAVFGLDAVAPFYDLVRVKAEVVAAERALSRLQGASGSANANEQRLATLTAVVEHGGADSDPTTQRLNEILERIEQVCRPVIESYGRTLAAEVLMRGRGALGILQSKPWFARLRRIWMRPHRASCSGHFGPPSDSSAS